MCSVWLELGDAIAAVAVLFCRFDLTRLFSPRIAAVAMMNQT